MAAKTRLVYQSDHLKVVKRSGNGRKSPPAVIISLPPLTEMGNPRFLSITIDEMFDLTEVLDDLCDEIEDKEEGVI